MATQRRGRKKEPRPWAVYARRRRLGLCIHCGWGEDTKFHREQCPGPPAALRPRLTLRPPVRTARGAAVAAGWVEKKSERRQGLIALKVRAGCKECRERHPACLEFHHRDSAQKAFTLSSPVALSKPWDVLLTEMAKCDVLCANCHRKRRWASRTRQSQRKSTAEQETAPMAKKAPRTKKADKGPKLVKHKKGPRSQTLPGHELVRDGRLDNLCEEIGDGLEQINKGTTAVKESKATALARMRDKGLMRYHFAGVTIRLREGADKLSVKLEKETQDPGGEPKASTEPPSKSETSN